jgi:hypothetical protein
MEKRTMLRKEFNSERCHCGHFVRFASFAIFAAWLGCSPGVIEAQAPGQKSFPSAEQASRAFFAAAQNDDEEGLLDILGPAGTEVISSGDPVEDLNSRRQFALKYQEMHRFVKEADGTTALYVGAENWPMPIPLVNKGGTWYFDTEAGKQEILSRRIGQNELEAVRACHELLDAQKQYYALARQGGPAKQYAQRFVSDAGRHNGLYWKETPDEFNSPIDPLVAAAGSGDSGNDQPGDPVPFDGYYFRMLTRQGRNAPGGAKSYVVDGRMTNGFAFLAYPVKYRSSGVMTLIVDQDGVVYEKDLGQQTGELTQSIKEYNPDSSWHKAE